MNQIEKPWCVYGSMALDIGIVTKERGMCCDIRYSEGQKYPEELWDSKFVRRFETAKTAINWLVEHTEDKEKPLWVVVKNKVPSQFKER